MKVILMAARGSTVWGGGSFRCNPGMLGTTGFVLGCFLYQLAMQTSTVVLMLKHCHAI